MKAYKTFLFILSVIFFLTTISFFFPEDGVALGSRQLYFPTIEDIASRENHNTTAASQRMREMEESLHMQRYQDSLHMVKEMAYQDSLSFYTTFFDTHDSRIYLPDSDYTFFDAFFQIMEDCGKEEEPVHILHYGDSQLEGDRITGRLRQRLQEKFGGNGAGLVPAVQPISSIAVGQSASEDIIRYIVSGSHINRAPHRRYGVLGQVGQMTGDGSITVNARNWKSTFENVKSFSRVRLFVGRTDGFDVSIVNTKKAVSKEDKTDTDMPLQEFSWFFDEPIKGFTLNMRGSAEIYGISVEGKGGVALDNIPFRGSSGTFFTLIDSVVMASMFQRLNTKMIILEFGGNMMPVVSSQKVIADYKVKMSQQINYLRSLCPDALILLIGPADMSKTVNGQLQTYPFLGEMVEGLKEAALENGAAFWNLYEVMGGYNSMISWVKNNPPLAASDYIHLTARGADKIADMFYETIMIYYDYYRFQKVGKEEIIDEL